MYVSPFSFRYTIESIFIVPSRKDKELTLTEQEGDTDHALKGAASWISNGIRLEEQK